VSTAASGNGRRERTSTLAVWAWAFYDFSNTIFSVAILSVSFPLWLSSELGAGPSAPNYATAAAAVLVVLTAPFLGAVADLRQRRIPYLILLTLLAVVFTAGLDLAGGVLAAVALFVAANFTYQSALIFYNALLPSVSAGRGSGRVSGYGTAVGYVGAILALLLVTYLRTDAETARSLLGPLGWWIDTGAERNSNAFIPTAILYLLFSLPAFFLIPDRAVREPRPVGLVSTYRGVFRTVRNIRDYAGLGTFIVATLLYTDAANTAVANMALYGEEVFEMDGTQIRNLLFVSTVFAGLGSLGFGFATDRLGPKRALAGVLTLWLLSIVLAAVAPAVWALYAAGPLIGCALGGTWTTSRVMLIALSPPEKIGEFFGIYGLVGKLSAVAGPLLTALLLDLFEPLGELAYRIAIGSLALIVGFGLLLVLRLPNAKPERTVEEFAAD
jgi:UMF1 family MFS transporter